MNPDEMAYAKQLCLRELSGEVAWWKFEAVKLRLADNTTYTPDFIVMLADGSIEFHEFKGFWEEDARVKIKVAAEMYPFPFRSFRKRSQKDGGGFSEEAFGPSVEKVKRAKKSAQLELGTVGNKLDITA